jgi:hypothetical protein
LADGEHIGADAGEVAIDVEQLVHLLAEADHDSGLGDDGGVEFLRKLEQAQGALVARSGAHGAIEARDGLGVVVEDLGVGVDDNFDGVFVALEVGDEDFDLAAGRLFADLFDDQGEGAGSAEDIVIAIDAGDDSEPEAERGDGLGDAARLIHVDGLGTALGHGAESAAAGAQVAQHHEGRGLVVPALADVGAVRGLADGMQVEIAGQLLEVVIIVAHRRARLQPVGLGDRLARGKVDLDEVRLERVRACCHDLLL